MNLMQRGVPTTCIAFVLDIVVYQEGIVHKLDRNCSRQCLFNFRTKCQRSSQAECTPKHPPAPKWIVLNKFVQMSHGLTRPKIFC